MNKKADGMEKKGRKILKGIAIALSVIVTLILLFLASISIADAACIKNARVVPDYEKINLNEILEKDSWDESDYDTLYRQTGLGKPALEKLKGNNAQILRFQDAFFYDAEIVQEQIAPTTKHDKLDGYMAPLAPLEEGDVIVTSSCHTGGWRNGHAAIVTNGEDGYILESYTLGEPSGFSNTNWFRRASNFIILRMKDKTKEERAEIAAWAARNMLNVEYNLTVGVFSKKDQGDEPKKTHCSHLVWQAFYHFGYDVDSDGGLICTANDIANSPLFEVVQVYGFDPDKLWE